MKELLAQILRMISSQPQPVQPPREIPQQQPQPGGALTNRSAYLAYVEQCAQLGKQHLPYAEWVKQGAPAH